MSNNTKLWLRIIAGICFLTFAGTVIYYMCIDEFYEVYLLELIGTITIAVSLFIAQPILLGVGSAIMTSAAIDVLIRDLIIGPFDWLTVLSLIDIAVWVVLLIAGFTKMHMKKLGLASCALMVSYYVVFEVYYKVTIDMFIVHALFLVEMFALIGGTLLIGLSAPDDARKPLPMPVPAPYPGYYVNGGMQGFQYGMPVQTKTEADYVAEKRIAHKQLLDSGLITQEEFDQKKKQILGL